MQKLSTSLLQVCHERKYESCGEETPSQSLKSKSLKFLIVTRCQSSKSKFELKVYFWRRLCLLLFLSLFSLYFIGFFFDKYRDTLRRVCGRKSYWPWQESIKWAALHCGMLMMMMMQCVSPTSKRRWPSAIKLCIICRYFLCSIYS